MAATNYTPIQLYYSTTASAAPTSGNLANGELAINITDGKLYYKDNGGVVQVIATKGAGTIGGSTTQIQYNNAGVLAGNAAMTFNNSTNVTTLTTLNLTNALGATYGGTAQSAYTQGDILYASATNTLSKLGVGTVNYILTSSGSVPQWAAPSSITVNTATNLAGGAGGSVPYQSAADTTTFLAIGAANRVMTSSGTAPQWVTALTGLTGVSSSSITNTSLTSGRLVYSTTGGAQTDSSSLTFNGTTLSAGGFSTTGLSTLVKTVTIGDSNFSGTAVFAAATPAKLYIGTGTVTDTTSAIGATNAVGAISSLAVTPIAATNTSVTYTNASTLYIAGAPSAGTNVTLTNPYALYVNGGASYFGGAVDFAVTPSYSGGTANGVMYLNASKQITTGTALTFSGTELLNTQNSNSGTYIVNRNVSTGTTATAYFNSDVTAAFSGYASFGARSTGYTTSGMLEANSGGVFTSGLTNGLNIMTLDGYPVKFGVNNDTKMWLTTSGTLGLGISNTFGAKLAVIGGAVNTSSAGLAISASLSAGRLTSGDTNNSTAYIGQFLDQSITELSAGSSGIYTSGIVAFGGTAAVNPNTVKTYTGGTVRTTADVNGFTIVGGLYASFATGAGVSQIGSASGRTQYQYTTYGGAIGGTDYGWQVGRSPTAGIVADGFYIYDIKESSIRLSIDASGNVGLGGGTPAGRFLSYQSGSIQNYQGAYGSSGTFQTGTGLVTLGGGANPRGIGVLINANRAVGTTLPYGNNYETFGLIAVANVGTGGGYGTTGIAGYAESDGGVYGLRADAKTTSTGGVSIAVGLYVGSVTGSSTNYGVYVADAAATNYFAGTMGIGTSTPSTSIGNGLHIATASGNSLILQKSTGAVMQFRSDATTIRASISGLNGVDGLSIATGASQTERVRIDSNGLFNAVYGSYTDPSLSSSGSNGLQILMSAAYNDNSTHQFNQMQNTASIIYVRSSGVCAVPFYPNAGGGIAYQWTALNPQTGAWITGQGPTINFTEASSSPNSYSIVFNGGGGSFTIQRTGGTTAYSVYIQRLAQS